MNFEVIPNSNSQLPGLAPQFFDSPLQQQNDSKFHFESINGHHNETKDECATDDRSNLLVEEVIVKQPQENVINVKELNFQPPTNILPISPLPIPPQPISLITPETVEAKELDHSNQESSSSSAVTNINFLEERFLQDPLPHISTENGSPFTSGNSESIEWRNNLSPERETGEPNLMAIARNGSRVSSTFVKQLSDSKLLLDESSMPTEMTNLGVEGFSTSHPKALYWLEQQGVDETPVKELLSGCSTPNNGRSPIPLSESGSESPYLDSMKRTLYLPTQSTILEEGSRDETNNVEYQDVEGDGHPLLNTRPRKFQSKYTRTISSLTEANDDDENESLNISSLSPSSKRKMRRRISISTTAPRASFDGDNSDQEERIDGERILSGKFEVPQVSIDEYDENFFEREGEESPHGSFMRSQSGEQSVASLPSVVHSVTDNMNWKKMTGTGIRKTRRSKTATPTKRGRSTLSTTKHVRQWDQTASAAEVVRTTMEDRIRDDIIDEEFIDAGSSAGLEIWVVDRGTLRLVSPEDIGLFYTFDCYIILSTSEPNTTSTKLVRSLHTWIGSQAEKDKSTIVAFKAQRLSKLLGGIHITTNLEGDETNDFIEVMYGNITVVHGSTTESSLKKVAANRGSDRFGESSVRLLLVSAENSNSLFPALAKSPMLQAIPLSRASFKSTSTLILDTGEDLIYQWRGALVSQLARARVFEAAFSLRSERIRRNPKCHIEVIDEGQEPEQFWELVDKFSIDRRDSMSEEPDDYSDEDMKDNESLSHGHEEATISSNESVGTNGSELLYDLDEIKEYCADQMDGHAEMHRRQILSQSRILDPQAFNLKDSSLEVDVIGQNIINLYRIGYVDGHLHTSRLSGINSEGFDFGPPRRSQLESKGVYLLDFKDEVYVWIGRESDPDLRVAAMSIAKALLQHSKAEWVRAVRVTEGNEPMLFKTKFLGWHEADMQEHSFRLRWNRLSISQHKSTGADKPLPSILEDSVKYMKHKRKRKTILNSKHHTVVRSKIAALERHAFYDILAEDDGRGIAVVWKVVDSELRSIPKNEVGHFWTHEAYVILYGFTPKVLMDENDSNQEESPHFVIYFWQGPHTPEKAYPQWKLSILPQKKDEWIEQMGQIPPEIRVTQGREPLHFFRMFKHRYIVHFAFLNLIKHRNKAEEKVRLMQTDILRSEKLRLNNLPVPRRSYRRVSGIFNSPNSRQLLNVARSSPKTSPGSRSPLHRDGSFTSIDSSVADDISSHTAPIGKSLYQMEISAGVLLFQVRGSGLIDEDVHAVQIEARASRLNSSDCYIAIRPSTRGQSFVWLWVGKGTQYFEQEAAGALAVMILRWIDKDAKGNQVTLMLLYSLNLSQVRVVEEGAGEWFDRWIVKSFYRALGGFSMYTNFDLLQTPRYLRPYALRYPQLFVCEYIGNEYTITMLERYCQADLVENVAAILDAHYALFVWYGRVCSASIKVTSMKVARRFCRYNIFSHLTFIVGSLKKGNKKLERPVVEVLQDQEPAPFISCFHGWCDWKLIEKPYIDPRRVRMEVRQSMGLLGDMAPFIGKPIEGLTLAQAEVLSREYKKRQAKLKKKEELRTPEKDSIRNRLRKAREDLYLQKHPPEPPKQVIVDASFRSPHCVPPPPHILQAIEEYARAAESVPDRYPQLRSESDDHSLGEKSVSTLPSQVFPISLSEIKANKLTPIHETNGVHTDPVQVIMTPRVSKESVQSFNTPPDLAPQPKYVSPLKKSNSRAPSQKRSPSMSLESSQSTPRLSISSEQSPHRPTLRETASSRLRRERLSQPKNNQPAFGYSKSTTLKPIPNSPAEPLQKTERKPYIDYLRQKPKGKSSTPLEKKH